MSSPAHQLRDGFTGAVSITPADDTDLDQQITGIIVGVTGNVYMTFVDGTKVVIPLVAGHVYRFLVTQVHDTSTTATGIVGLF